MQSSMSQKDKQRSVSALGAVLTGPQKKNLKQDFNIKIHNLSKLKTEATAAGMPLNENDLLQEAT